MASLLPDVIHLNPHPHMRAPCGPKETLLGVYSAIVGIPE